MDYIHDPYRPNETIAAVATPPGEGGVAIIRISGENSIALADTIFSGSVTSYKSHTAHFGKIINIRGEFVDDVLLLVMKGPRSYTGEDTVEIQCHGGSLITRRVLETVIEAGARAAKPGEFTFKAFMNGKLDLAQAEAVQELISAKNEYAVLAAESQLKGQLTRKILDFQLELTKIAAILEAWVDFPEEDLEFATMDEVCDELGRIQLQMRQLSSTFHDGRILHEGLSLCLVGSPNVGKSSLMNALLDKDRAIVSPIAGTTRDVVEDYIRLNGLNVKLVDTAGIRETDEVVEKEGIKRSKEALDQADLVLLVLDVYVGLRSEDIQLLKLVPKEKSIAVWNKTDLPHHDFPLLDLPHAVAVSALNRVGIEQLKEEINRIIWKKGPPSKEEVLITKLRHKEALDKAVCACNQVIMGLKGGVSPEFLSMDMRSILSELGKIIGTNVSDDILNSIFSQFCIGK